MTLTPEQKTTVATWAKEGCGLSEIQRRLASQFSINMTYIDVRLLVIELGAAIQERPKAQPAADLKAAPARPEPPPAPAEDAVEDLGAFEEEPAGLGGVAVDIDRVVRPGALVSGSVTFSDGVKASWALDQMGRLALSAAGNKEYRPSQADAQAFQQAVVRELRKLGYA